MSQAEHGTVALLRVHRAATQSVLCQPGLVYSLGVIMRTLSCAAGAAAALAAVLGALPSSALAQLGGWGSRWDEGPRRGYERPWDGSDPRTARASSRRDPREGKVDVSRFVGEGDAAQLLGHGPVTVSSQAVQEEPTSLGGAQDYLPQKARAPFEAAVIDRLVAAGYDTMHADPAGGQVAELRVSREVLVPMEEKRNPVSGTAAMEVGTRGSAYGLAVNVDMTKPRNALLSTRLDARIRDKVSGKILWEGRASIATREGDSKWTDGMIASRLAEALFDDFAKPAVPAGA